MKILKFNLRKKEQDFFIFGDVHFGTKLCDKKKLKEDLDEAKKRNCRILCDGDIFDMILPKDPRYAPKQMEERYVGRDDAVDMIIEDAVKFFKPYAKYIDVLGDGNHEQQLGKRFSTNPVARLVRRLNGECKTDIKYGGYFYYAIYEFYWGNKSKMKHDYTILIHHGMGGNSAVTKGIATVAKFRRAGWFYNLFAFGHGHSSIAAKDMYIYPNTEHGKLFFLDMIEAKSLQTGTYQKLMKIEKEDNSDLGEWAEQKGFPPSCLGGNFVNVKSINKRKGTRKDDTYDVKNMEFITTIEV